MEKEEGDDGNQILIQSPINDLSMTSSNTSTTTSSRGIDSNKTPGQISKSMLQTVLMQKNNLNISLSNGSAQQNESPCRAAMHALNLRNTLSAPTTSSQHHLISETASQVSSGPTFQEEQQCHSDRSNTRHQQNQKNTQQVYQHPMPDLPQQCSIEVQGAHQDILLRAGGATKVKRIYNELAAIANCLGGWKELLERSPKAGNTLLMWLCCKPLMPKQSTFSGSTSNSNSSLYSQIIVVTMAMIQEAYEKHTKDDAESQCLLFARNHQEASALELAALTNKSIIASWLA